MARAKKNGKRRGRRRLMDPGPMDVVTRSSNPSTVTPTRIIGSLARGAAIAYRNRDNIRAAGSTAADMGRRIAKAVTGWFRRNKGRRERAAMRARGLVPVKKTRGFVSNTRRTDGTSGTGAGAVAYYPSHIVKNVFHMYNVDMAPKLS